MNTKRVLASGILGPRYGSQLATATGTYRSPNPRDLHILTKLATAKETD